MDSSGANKNTNWGENQWNKQAFYSCGHSAHRQRHACCCDAAECMTQAAKQTERDSKNPDMKDVQEGK